MNVPEMRAWAAQIKEERRIYSEDENLIHNRELHRRILTAWRMDSPKMMARLERFGMADDLAFVVQERMWRESDALEKAGYPVTDAREMAEREHLMLEPEDQEEQEEQNPLEM